MLNLIGTIYVVQLTADGALTILRFQHAATRGRRLLRSQM
jgi:hypothetical protein